MQKKFVIAASNSSRLRCTKRHVGWRMLLTKCVSADPCCLATQPIR